MKTKQIKPPKYRILRAHEKPNSLRCDLYTYDGNDWRVTAETGGRTVQDILTESRKVLACPIKAYARRIKGGKK